MVNWLPGLGNKRKKVGAELVSARNK